MQGPYTREDGFLGYNEICVKQMQETGPGAGWAVHWDPHHEAPFMYRWVVTQHIARAVFISFNNVSEVDHGSQYPGPVSRTTA